MPWLLRELSSSRFFPWTIAAKCGLFAADVYFIDNSLLHFRELWIGQGRRQKKTYTYHYQRADGALVFRYDNAPHYPDLPSAPHHKHTGENDILAAETPDLFQVLKEIEDIIGSSAK